MLLSRLRLAGARQQQVAQPRWCCCRGVADSKPGPDPSVANPGAPQHIRKQKPRGAGYLPRQQQQQQQEQEHSPPAAAAPTQPWVPAPEKDVGCEVQAAASDLVCSLPSEDEVTHTELLVTQGPSHASQLTEQLTPSPTATHNQRHSSQQQQPEELHERHAIGQQHADTSQQQQQQPQESLQRRRQHRTSNSQALVVRQQSLAVAHYQPNTNGFRPMVVPWQHRGLMYQRNRPWMKEVVMHLCTGLAPPACYIYQEMTPAMLQRVAQARLALEAGLRGHIEELRWQCSRMETWMQQAAAGDRLLPAQGLEEAAQQLQTLKSAAGRCRTQLHALRRKAQAYSDADYVAYTEPMRDMLREVYRMADVLLEHYIPHLHKVGELQVRSARLAGLQLDVDAQQLTKLWQQHQQQARHKFTPCELPSVLDWEAFSWRYPPNEYVWVKPKGVAAADQRRPLRLPGEAVKLAAVRPHIRRLQRGRGNAALSDSPPVVPDAGSQQYSSSSSSSSSSGGGGNGSMNGHACSNSNGKGNSSHADSSSSSSSRPWPAQGQGVQDSSSSSSSSSSSRGPSPQQDLQQPGGGARRRQRFGRTPYGVTPLQRQRVKTRRFFDSQ